MKLGLGEIDKVTRHGLLSRALSGHHPEAMTGGMEPLVKLRRTVSNWRAARRNAREEAPISARLGDAAHDAGLLVGPPRPPRLEYAIRRVRAAVAGELPERLRAECETWLAWAEAGGEMRGIRAQLGLTQEALAERIGISSTQVARIERGESGVSEPVLRLARTLRA